MVWRILRHIFKKHLLLHLIIPLLAGLSTHVLAAHWIASRDWREALGALWSVETMGLIIGILGAYLLIMFHLTRKETSIKLAGPDLAILNGALNTAAYYFATSTIGMKEWFDPISQVFLANIVGRKLRQPPFEDARVLLLSRPGESKALESPYIDGYYAQRLAELHRLYRIPLGFLERSEVVAILHSMSPQDRRELGCYPGWLSWLSDKLLDKIPLSFRRRLPELDFALVRSTAGQNSVLRVAKRGQNVRIKAIEGAATRPYEGFVEQVKKRVYTPHAVGVVPRLDDGHDFVKRFYPF